MLSEEAICMNIQAYEDNWWEKVGQRISDEDMKAIFDAAAVAPSLIQKEPDMAEEGDTIDEYTARRLADANPND